MRVRSRWATWALAATAVACAACADIWGFEDLRAGDAAAGDHVVGGGEGGAAGDASASMESGRGSGGDANGSSSGADASASGSGSGSTSLGGDSGDAGDATIEAGVDGSGSNDAANQAACATDGGTGAIGTLGCPCSTAGAAACNGNNQRLTLLCSSGTWVPDGTCPSGQLCDSQPGSNQGTCQPVDSFCASATPGQDVCSGSTTVVRCGPDLVSDSPVTTCNAQACVAGVCSGVCTPATTRCTSDTQVETCRADGQWGAATTCANSCAGGDDAGAGGNCSGVCVPGATQCTSDTQLQTCGTEGQWGAATTCADACVSLDGGSVDGGGAGGACAGVCVPGATQCTTDTQVETCGTDGQWGAATTCADACVNGSDGGSGGNCGGLCVPGAVQCSGGAVETCGSNGQWSSAVPCPASTPNCAAGVCGAPPSCPTSGSGLVTCGASSESCCTSPEVTGGMYYRTYTNSGSGPTGEADQATVGDFRLDKYLVTVGRFRQFVTAWSGGAGYTPPAGSGIHAYLNGGQGLANSGNPGTYETGWQTSWNASVAPTTANLTSCSPYTWTASAGSQENLPINCVNWYEAYAFCAWDGGFLPSEAEWEYAAAGGTEQLEYAWGSTAPGTACPGTGCQYAIYDCDYPSGSGTCAGVLNIAPVGTATLGAGRWGQFDLAGEVLEWNLDWYATYVDPCVDCAYLTTATSRVLRGGLYASTASGLLPPSRASFAPGNRFYSYGVRCSRSP